MIHIHPGVQAVINQFHYDETVADESFYILLFECAKERVEALRFGGID